MIVDFEHPNIELDDEIWIICGPNDIMKSTVTAFQGLVFKDNKKNLEGIFREVIISHFVLNDYFYDLNGALSIVPFKYTTKDEDKAREWMKVYPVYMTDEEWLLAIGDRDKGEDEIGNIDDGCELSCCCANISDVRDCLIRCKDKHGLIGWEREDLQWKINNCNHDRPNQNELLDKIFSQLEVEWS